jgi:hypothetical protein
MPIVLPLEKLISLWGFFVQVDFLEYVAAIKIINMDDICNTWIPNYLNDRRELEKRGIDHNDG